MISFFRRRRLHDQIDRQLTSRHGQGAVVFLAGDARMSDLRALQNRRPDWTMIQASDPEGSDDYNAIAVIVAVSSAAAWSAYCTTWHEVFNSGVSARTPAHDAYIEETRVFLARNGECLPPYTQMVPRRHDAAPTNHAARGPSAQQGEQQ